MKEWIRMSEHPNTALFQSVLTGVCVCVCVYVCVCVCVCDV